MEYSVLWLWQPVFHLNIKAGKEDIMSFITVGVNRQRKPCLISLLEGSLKSASLKTMVVSFLGQAIYVQLVDVDFESCRVAGQPGSSQGHFLCSTPYRVRLSRAADRAALAATVVANMWRSRLEGIVTTAWKHAVFPSHGWGIFFLVAVVISSPSWAIAYV